MNEESKHDTGYSIVFTNSVQPSPVSRAEAPSVFFCWLLKLFNYSSLFSYAWDIWAISQIKCYSSLPPLSVRRCNRTAQIPSSVSLISNSGLLHEFLFIKSIQFERRCRPLPPCQPITWLVTFSLPSVLPVDYFAMPSVAKLHSVTWWIERTFKAAVLA